MSTSFRNRDDYRRSAGLETVEYAIVTGLVVLAAITGISILGGWVTSVFSQVNSALAASSAL